MYFEYAKHLATWHIFCMQLESGEKGWVKVTDWNSFQTGTFYQLCGSCLLFWWPVTILKLRARSAMSIHSFSIMLMHSFCLIVLLHASSQKNAGTRFRTVFLIVTVCAYVIVLLQAILIQWCKYIILEDSTKRNGPSNWSKTRKWTCIFLW